LAYKDVQLTNDEVKALRATPIQIVPAPGTNKALVYQGHHMVAKSASGAWTESADNLVLEYGDGSDIETIETTGFLTAGGTAFDTQMSPPDRSTVGSNAIVANSKIQLKNSGDGEFGGGNAVNTLSVRVYYSIVPTTDFD